MPFHPFGGSVEGFAAVFGEAWADAAHHGSVYTDAADDRLAFSECRKFSEHLAACTFDRLSDRLLIDRVYDAHNYLRHALREHVLIELARPLCDEADADAELAAFAEDLAEDVSRNDTC